jgi:hypothetical protein
MARSKSIETQEVLTSLIRARRLNRRARNGCRQGPGATIGAGQECRAGAGAAGHPGKPTAR